MPSIWDGIIIAGVGGAIAALTVLIVKYARTKFIEKRDKKHIYEWLKANTSNEPGKQFRSTKAIASWNNLSEERVRYICNIHDKIFLSTGERKDMWSLYERTSRKSVRWL